jgi:hypothetical protein
MKHFDSYWRIYVVFAFAFVLAVFVAFARPAYNAGPAPVLVANSPYTMWNNETPTPGNGTTAASQQVVLTKNGIGTGFSCDGKFSGAPGVFEVDVQVTATDTDTSYQTVSNGNIATVDATNNTFHFDGTLVDSKFLRLLMRTRTNSVTIFATCRQ